MQNVKRITFQKMFVVYSPTQPYSTFVRKMKVMEPALSDRVFSLLLLCLASIDSSSLAVSSLFQAFGHRPSFTIAFLYLSQAITVTKDSSEHQQH